MEILEPPLKNSPFLHLTKDMTFDPENFGMRAFSELNVRSEMRKDWGMVDVQHPPWLEEVHNAFLGQRCFLFGTGPSLIDQLPLLGAMKNEFTFTCNRMKQWEEIPFTPWLHTVTEPGPFTAWGHGIGQIYQFPEAANKVGCCWFPVQIPGWNWLPKAPDDVQVRWQGVMGMGDYLPPIPSAWASPLTIAQLALWMGFTELYVLGCDITQQGQAWDREKGTTKFPRNIRSIVECADRMRSQIWLNGREIYDCTPGGRLSREGVLPYKDLAEVLA